MIDQSVSNMPVGRVWILGDLHFGVRANSMEWLEIQKDFFENLFIPTLKKHVQPGDVLVQVGDTFDNRQSINIKVLNYAVKLFERLGEILPVHVIVGNHDIWAKNSNEITSIDSLKWIPNVQIYIEPTILKWNDRNVLMMPWRRDIDQEAQTLADHPTAEIVFCHSEVRGIKLNQKVTNDHGTDVEVYDRYTRVYSGHIHYRQERNKLLMVGVPYQLTRSDSGNQKGFYLVDLKNMEETFYANRISPEFVKFSINSIENMTLGEFKAQIQNNFVDLYAPSHVAISQGLSRLINKVQGVGRKLEPFIYGDDQYLGIEDYDQDQFEELHKNYNVMSMCNSYVESTQYDDEIKDKLKHKLKNIYDRCVYNYSEADED